MILYYQWLYTWSKTRKGGRMNQRRILIADDEKSMRHLLLRALRNINHTIDCARDGLEATRKLRDHDYDLVITDYHMPGMNGFELAQWIKANQPAIPVILITGNGPMRKPANSNILVCVSKPFKIMEIRSLANRLLLTFC